MAPEGWTLKVEIPPSMNRSAPFLSADQLLIWLRNRLPSFQKAGTEYRGACPIHKGGDANFTINPDKGVGYCHSKCQRGFSVVQIEAQITGASIREAIREIRRITGAPVPNGHGGLIELEAYDYVDEQGQLLFQQVRLFDGAQGKKTFRSRRPGPDGRWLSGLAGVRRVLYRLPAVLKAATVFIVEGEKDVHTIERWGLTATTNPLGAGKWEDSYSESLHGKDVVISIDNDGPGLRHGEAVAARLAGKAKSVVVVTMPRPYKDISDWQQSGATKADFLAAIELTRAEENKTARESSKPPIYDGHQYCFWNRGIWGFRQTASGHVPFEITNFEAVVVQDRLLDDGSGEEARVFGIRATVNRNEIEVESTAKEFCTMSWVSEKLGAMAIVYPNRTEHLRAAIQTLSEDIRTVRVYSHTGWRRIDGHEHYLHAGGAIGSRGIRTDIRVKS